MHTKVLQQPLDRPDALDELRKHERECEKRYASIRLWLILVAFAALNPDSYVIKIMGSLFNF